MNIGIFTDTYYPEINGVANSAYELKNRLEQRGHTVYVFTVKNPEAEGLNEKHVFRIRSLPFVLLKERRVGSPFVKHWRKIMSGLHLDVIHTQTEFTIGHLGRKTAEYLHIPHVHTYHTIYEDYTHYLRVPGNYKMKGMARSFSRYCCNHADELIVPTDKVKTLLKTYHVARNIRIVPTGIDLEKFKHPNDNHMIELRKRYGISDENQVLLYIGRISEEKNLREVLDYFAKIEKQDKLVRLLIVGDGPQKQDLEKLSCKMNLQDKIIFTGMVDWNDVQDYYALGDIFVSSSVSETQGLTYAEALSSGVPLLVRKDSCLNGVLKEKQNGMSYENEEEFITGYHFLVNKKKLSEYCRNISESINALSGNQFACNVEEVYMQLIQKVKERGYYGEAGRVDRRA